MSHKPVAICQTQVMVSGLWEGYYAYDGDPNDHFDISARFSVSGSKLIGRMTDLRVENRITLVELVENMEAEDPPVDLAVWRGFLDEYPDAAWVTLLPRESALKGSVKGLSVRFSKKYLAGQEQRWIATGLDQLEDRLKPHTVEYVGTLCRDLIQMEGTWEIRSRIENWMQRSPRVSGSFRLHWVESSS